MVHQKKLQRMLRLFCCTIPYSAAFLSPRESPRCVVGRKNLTGATRCTIPFGAGSAFTRALRFASRGPVAKNAPPERF